MKTITTSDNADLRYASTEGLNPALLFVHGWANNHTVWRHIIERLPYKAITVDLRGHGPSTPGEQLSMQRLVDDIHRVRREVGHDNILVGHSLGGMITTHLLAEAADSQAILINASAANITSWATLMQGPISVAGQLLHSDETTDLSNTPNPFNAFIRGAKDCDEETLTKCLSIMQHHADSLPHRIQATPLLVRSTNDTSLGAAHHQSLKTIFNEAAVERIHADHNPHIEHPSAVAQAIKAYVD